MPECISMPHPISLFGSDSVHSCISHIPFYESSANVVLAYFRQHLEGLCLRHLEHSEPFIGTSSWAQKAEGGYGWIPNLSLNSQVVARSVVSVPDHELLAEYVKMQLIGCWCLHCPTCLLWLKKNKSELWRVLGKRDVVQFKEQTMLVWHEQ